MMDFFPCWGNSSLARGLQAVMMRCVKRWIFPLLALLMALLAVRLWGQVEGLKSRFEAFDRNADGRIAGDEMKAAAILPKLDLNGDGELTFPEALKAVAAGKLKARRQGAMAAASALGSQEWEQLQQAPAPIKPSAMGVGRQIADWQGRDLQGQALSLAESLQGRRGLLLACVGATCPISRKFGPELKRLEADCAEKQVAMLLLFAVAGESRAEVEAYLKDFDLKSRALHDDQGSLGRVLRPASTTEVWLLDERRTLRYRGAINDQYGLGYALPQPRRAYLREAMDAMLAGKVVQPAATTAPGCAISWEEVAAAPGPALEYHRDIERLLQRHCLQCHRSGGAGPFALETYEQVLKHAPMMAKQVRRGAMPPWFAAAPAKGELSPWANDCSLEPQDKADLLSWLEGDRRRGDPREAPLPMSFDKEWNLGPPGQVVQLPKPIEIKAEGTMPYQFVVVPVDLNEDRWVQGYEILPTDSSVVHHVIVQMHPPGSKASNRGEGTEGYWAAYVPGNTFRLWPKDFAKLLPKGASLSFQIHYTPNGKATQDQLRMGLYFAAGEPRYELHTAAVAKRRLEIPPGEANHVEVFEQRVPANLQALSFLAHLHVRGKAFKYEWRKGDEPWQTLLDIPRYDFNWQLRYDRAKPLLLSAGSTLRITAVFDNSPGNPANPDPTRTVRWGPQTADEMMIGYVEYFTPRAHTAGR